MDKTVSAVAANRHFSRILRGVRKGDSYVVTTHGKPVAPILPAGTEVTSLTKACCRLLARLDAEPVVDVGPWTRDELYDR